MAENTNFPPKMCVVAGALIKKGNQVLLVRQTYGRLTGYWGLPTGFVDEGEQPHLAVLRETQEEAGITATLIGLQSVSIFDLDGQPALYMAFLGEHRSGEPVPDGIENDRARYFSIDELENHPEPIEELSLWLAQRHWSGDDKILHFHAISHLHESYQGTFA